MSKSKISQLGLTPSRVYQTSRSGSSGCCTSTISFICFESPKFLKFCRILNIGYVPRSRRVIATSLLDAANSNVENWKQSVLSRELILNPPSPQTEYCQSISLNKRIKNTRISFQSIILYQVLCHPRCNTLSFFIFLIFICIYEFEEIL